MTQGITAFVFDPSTGRITRIGGTRYAVETRFVGDQWCNCWTTSDGKPVTFATRDEAESELQSMLDDIDDAVADGSMSDGYDPEDFRIVEVAHV